MTQKAQKVMLALSAMIFIFIIVVFGVVPIVRASDERKNHEEQVVLQVVPDAEEYSNPDSKRTGYRNGGTGEYFNSLDEEENEGRERISRKRPKDITVEDVFRPGETSDDMPEAKPRKGRTGGVSSSSRGSGSGSSASHPERPSGHSTEEETTSSEAKKDTATAQPRPQIKRSGAVSSLDEDVSSDLGNGFSTLDGRDAWVENEESKAYRCMFTRSEKVSSGQRVSVRLLEDLVIGNTHIPQNTHLQGVCKISDRMELSLTSLDMGGRILTFHFEAYDTDGQKGIYCSDLSSEAQEITNKGIGLGSSALNRRLTGTAREIANIGASIVRNNAGEVSVNIPSGYTFYIIEEKK